MQQQEEELKLRLPNKGRKKRKLFWGVVESFGNIGSWEVGL
jgi:hypothetical protein